RRRCTLSAPPRLSTSATLRPPPAAIRPATGRAGMGASRTGPRNSHSIRVAGADRSDRMVPASSRAGRGMPLTLRLSLALVVASFFVAVLVAFLGAERTARGRVEEEAGDQQRFAQQFAERIAPLLDRGDLLRLSMLATAGRDFADARVLVLD